MLAENSAAPGSINFRPSFCAFTLGLPKTTWWFLPTKIGLEAEQPEKAKAAKMKIKMFFM
jgi:hypothetical protein